MCKILSKVVFPVTPSQRIEIEVEQQEGVVLLCACSARGHLALVAVTVVEEFCRGFRWSCLMCTLGILLFYDMVQVMAVNEL